MTRRNAARGMIPKTMLRGFSRSSLQMMTRMRHCSTLPKISATHEAPDEVKNEKSMDEVSTKFVAKVGMEVASISVSKRRTLVEDEAEDEAGLNRFVMGIKKLLMQVGDEAGLKFAESVGLKVIQTVPTVPGPKIKKVLLGQELKTDRDDL